MSEAVRRGSPGMDWAGGSPQLRDSPPCPFLGDVPLELGDDCSLALVWRNNERLQEFVLVASKELECAEDPGSAGEAVAVGCYGKVLRAGSSGSRNRGPWYFRTGRSFSAGKKERTSKRKDGCRRCCGNCRRPIHRGNCYRPWSERRQGPRS